MSEETKEQSQQKSINDILDAVKELTKVVSDLKQEFEKWRKAGKF